VPTHSSPLGEVASASAMVGTPAESGSATVGRTCLGASAIVIVDACTGTVLMAGGADGAHAAATTTQAMAARIRRLRGE
jgi:D-alanyl-D-alanine carboxypeptidase